MFLPLMGSHQATHIKIQKEAFLQLLQHAFFLQDIVPYIIIIFQYVNLCYIIGFQDIHVYFS